MLFAQPPLVLPGATLDYRPGWLQPSEADAIFARLLSETPWQQPQLFIHGRYVTTPRLTAWYGDRHARYRYSGVTHQPLPWTPLLTQLRERLQLELAQPLNAVLLNYYRDGQDSMGWHSDDEPVLGRNPLIVSLNLGATRRFDLRRVGGSRIEHSIELEHGSLLVMSGATQHHWQHQVAKSRRVMQPRLNLTFRLIRFAHE